MIYFADTELLGLKIGDTDISAVYAGDLLIYPTTVTAWSVTPTVISEVSSGGSVNIKIAALSSWTISSSESWVTLSQASGDSGRTTVVATIGNNTSTSRTATITVTDGDQFTQTISVSQEELAFSVSPTAITAQSAATAETITISSPYSWTIVSSESWITFSQDSGANGTYTVTATIASASTERTATITVSNGYSSSAISVEQVFDVYQYMPVTLEITKAGNLRWYTQNGSYTKTIEYKKNDGEWTQITSSNAGTLIPVAVGDIVQLRGDNAQYAPQDGRCSCWCGTTANYKMYGNIMSLVDSTGFTTLSSFTAPNVFMNFFNSGGCIDAENLVLPATALTNYCYQGMLAQSANLQVGPLLPVETLVQGCYAYLFYHSYQINNIRCLATDKNARNCLQEWVNGAPSSGTFYKNPNMSSWNRGRSGVPNNWTIVDYS